MRPLWFDVAALLRNHSHVRANQIIRRGKLCFGLLLLFKIVRQKVMKKYFVQQTLKNKKLVHKTDRKMGLSEGKKIACSFA